MIYCGSRSVRDIYIGGTRVYAIYVGDRLAWLVCPRIYGRGYVIIVADGAGGGVAADTERGTAESLDVIRCIAGGRAREPDTMRFHAAQTVETGFARAFDVELTPTYAIPELTLSLMRGNSVFSALGYGFGITNPICCTGLGGLQTEEAVKARGSASKVLGSGDGTEAEALNAAGQVPTTKCFARMTASQIIPSGSFIHSTLEYGRLIYAGTEKSRTAEPEKLSYILPTISEAALSGGVPGEALGRAGVISILTACGCGNDGKAYGFMAAMPVLAAPGSCKDKSKLLSRFDGRDSLSVLGLSITRLSTLLYGRAAEAYACSGVGACAEFLYCTAYKREAQTVSAGGFKGNDLVCRAKPFASDTTPGTIDGLTDVFYPLALKSHPRIAEATGQSRQSGIEYAAGGLGGCSTECVSADIKTDTDNVSVASAFQLSADNAHAELHEDMGGHCRGESMEAWSAPIETGDNLYIRQAYEIVDAGDNLEVY